MASGRCDVRVRFPSASPMANTPAHIEITQVEFLHDTMVLTYYVQSDWWKNRFKNGSPVAVTWGILPQLLDTFYGHVLFAVPHVENEKHSLRVVCIGPSYGLKDIVPTIYPGLSVEQTIALTLQSHRFNLITDRSSKTWPSLTRTVHESLWTYMKRVAQRSGYTLYANKTTVCAYNPVDVLLANLPSYPIFDFVYGRGNQHGTMLSFHAQVGDDGAGSLRNLDQRALGVDPRTGQMVGASDDGSKLRRLNPVSAPPRFAEYAVDQPVHSSGEAQSLVSGRKSAERWTQKATARVYGNVRVTQGSGVVLRGINGQDDGIWYVHKVVHELSTEEHPTTWTYFMDLELRRDSRQQNLQVPTRSRPLRPLVSVVDLQTNRQALAPVLVKGLWVAPHARTTVVAV